jgi:hypothetical protein
MQPLSNKSNTIRARLGVESLEDRTVPAYFGSSGGYSVAVGDVLSDNAPTVVSTNDVITGAGPGLPGIVRIANGSNVMLQYFYPFGTAYKGGIYVATGDIVGDGHVDLICASGGGMVGTVKVYEYINGGMQLIDTVKPFGANYTGGIDVAAGNVTGEVVGFFNAGAPDQLVFGEANGGSTVKVYGYDNIDPVNKLYQIRSFQAYPASYKGGVTLAVADINTTGLNTYSSIITGMATTLPEVEIWNVVNPTPVRQAEYMAFDTTVPAFRTGINVAAGDTTNQQGAQIYVNLRGTGTIRIFDGQTSAILYTFNTYPVGFGNMVNMAIGGVDEYAPPEDDQTTGFDYIRDLVIVSANVPISLTQYNIPIVYQGALFGPPAGENGSRQL